MTDTGYTKRAARVLTLTEQAAGGGEQTTEHLLIALIGKQRESPARSSPPRV